MEWIFFFVAAAMIFYTGANTAEIYAKEANSARSSYLTEHEEEFHRFHLSSEEALSKVKWEKSGDHKVLASFFWVALVLFVVAIFIVANVGKNAKDGQMQSALIISMIWLAWGYLSALVSTGIANSGVKEHIYKRLESFRCPHCNAPLCYFETDMYNDGEVYFQKRVKKYDFDLKMDIYINENWVRYNEHHIFTCDYCRKKDDKIKQREEKAERTSLLSSFGGIRA